MASANITSKGQVTIPASMRAARGLAADRSVSIEEMNAAIAARRSASR
jgi:bifunctional DNA-binding transcriptional regulator/antitoxin component of YhaV-PrlF toxin-antitoxin module